MSFLTMPSGTSIQGGAPSGPSIISLSDSDMKEVETLRMSGKTPSKNALKAIRRHKGVTRGQHWESFKRTLHEQLATEAGSIAAKRDFESMKRNMLVHGLHSDCTISEISCAYGNDDYIGLDIMPRVFVPNQGGQFIMFDRRSQMATSDARIGQGGDITEIHREVSKVPFYCKEYGKKGDVDYEELASSCIELDPMFEVAEAVAEELALLQEVRIAAAVANPANYAGNVTTLAPVDQWNSAGGGNPIADIQNAIASTIGGAGPGRMVAVCNRDVYNVLSRHPAILAFYQFNGSAPGLATPSMIAQFFGLDDFLVGGARVDLANEGQPADYGHIWPNMFAIIRVATNPGRRNASFGYTLTWDIMRNQRGMHTRQWYEANTGINGKWWHAATHATAEVGCAPLSSYLIQNPIDTSL